MPERIHEKENYFEKLETLMKVLRKECPWDNQQTLSSLRTYTLEETHEVLEAIDEAANSNNWSALRDELGDLLLQIAFYACIADERGEFSLSEVFQGLIDKMIYRHPHVFNGAKPTDLNKQWDSLKDNEHKQRTSLMDGIPPLPALAKAKKIQSRAARAGFDWEEPADVIEKMHEELHELEEEVRHTELSHPRIESEFGDVLFTLVNLARKLDVDAELALMQTNRKFSNRFRKMEQLAESKGMKFSELSLADQEKFYLSAKQQEAQ